MKRIAGIGKLDRERLALILRATDGVIDVTEAAGALKLPSNTAAKLLSRWSKRGWLSRVRRGMYIPVPIESLSSDVPIEDPWIVAARLFEPCYIGGWSAAAYWDLTEQIFRTVAVFSTKKIRKRSFTLKGIQFQVRTISEKALFGLQSVWRGKVKIAVSDPARTLVDLLSDPMLGGGIRPTADTLSAYLASEKKDLKKLLEYASRFNNGAVFKRLGFLLERLAPNERETIEVCKAQLTQGKAMLAPNLPADKLVTRWRLWVPQSWATEIPRD